MGTGDWLTVLATTVGAVVAVLGGVRWMLERSESRTQEALAGASAAADTRFADHRAASERHSDARFEHVDARFEHVDARFEHVDGRFETLTTTLRDGLTRIESAVDRVNDRLDALAQDNRLLGERLARVEAREPR